MSRSGIIDEPWGDGTYRFRLAYAQLEELEGKCGAGTYEIYARLAPRTDMLGRVVEAPGWHIADLFHTIRLGLIGGGMAANEALKLVLKYFDDWPKVECALLCEKILGECLSGHPEEAPGKEAGEANPASTSPASTEPAAPPARRRKKSAG